MRRPAVLAFFLACASAPAGDAISVRLLDGSGRPAADVGVSQVWFLEKGAWHPYGKGGRTDAAGRLEIPKGTDPVPGSLSAFDFRRKLGAVFPTHPDDPGDYEVRLEPLVSVPIRLRWQEGDRPVGAYGADVYRMPEGACLMKVRTGAEELPLALPPGDYTLIVYGHQLETRTVDFRLPRDAESLSRDGVRLVPSRLAGLVGRDLPAWSVTESRGVKADAAPADFRGKWLMVAVWGFW